MKQLTIQQIHFFETFGYLVLPGLMADSMDWIEAEFEAVFTDRGIVHDGSKRSNIVPFVDQSERFCQLIDDHRIEGLAAGLLGEDYNYIISDGNYYTGDTNWHSDGSHPVGKYIKVAFYLDTVTADTGALRVIPGSHHPELKARWNRLLQGVDSRTVPAVALESAPGDVVAFDHNLLHAAFGGNTQRRMFTINFARHVETPEEIADLREFIGLQSRFWIDRMHSAIMRDTASPRRWRHLRQVIEHESHMAELAERAKEELLEPSRW